MGTYWILLPALLVLLVGAALVWVPIRSAARRSWLEEARREFHWQRERLEAKFVQIGLRGGSPSGPRWADCDFDDDVSYVRNRSSGELSAFVSVSITLDAPAESFEDADEWLRSGTAVFRFDGDHWETDGRAIFNLSPSEAIRFYHDDLEVVGEELLEKQ